ncbi:phytanoyl-CoA dioxygenase family protein [Peristeroidobacter soli]|uniref:phytanoyl-CoA dioxygenase family protein n=1 Tax=Peristeroidobacter soli TaxID=2497877 RepID=UPI00101DF258|nr:phytanoyl-CoA dioxygenase family protein [Peristeroidobacter soli]
MKLTAEQIRSFHNSGFLAVAEPVLDGSELNRLIALYDRMFAEQAGRADGNQFDLAGPDSENEPARLSQILHPHRYFPELRGAYVDRLHSVAGQLLGPEAKTEIFHAILKPAGIGVRTPWHQDEAYWKPDRQYRSISIWIPLQIATEENGCLWFNDGSHEWEVLEHRSIGGDARVHGLELVDDSVIRHAVACPLPAGGFTIHRNRTAHYAGPNLTEAPRRALVVSSVLPDRPYPALRRFPWNEVKNTQRKMRAGGDAGSDHT